MVKYINFVEQLLLALLLGIGSSSIAKSVNSQTPVVTSLLQPIDVQTLQSTTPLDFSPVLADLELTIPANATTEASIQLAADKPTPEDSQYIIAPHVVSDAQINPFTTTLPLNGTSISHLTQWEALGGYNFGDHQNGNLIFNGVVKLNSSISESLTRNHILTIEQKGTYAQLQTVRQFRQVDVSRAQPQTLTGVQIQLSLTAPCVGETNSATAQCSYTPGLVTDRSSIDPQFLVPTRIDQTADVFDVVTPESLAVMRLPGFQLGANGQQIGVDLYFPNAGALPGNSQSTRTTIERTETIEDTPALTISGIRQIRPLAKG